MLTRTNVNPTLRNDNCVAHAMVIECEQIGVIANSVNIPEIAPGVYQLDLRADQFPQLKSFRAVFPQKGDDLNRPTCSVTTQTRQITVTDTHVLAGGHTAGAVSDISLDQANYRFPSGQGDLHMIFTPGSPTDVVSDRVSKSVYQQVRRNINSQTGNLEYLFNERYFRITINAETGLVPYVTAVPPDAATQPCCQSGSCKSCDNARAINGNPGSCGCSLQDAPANGSTSSVGKVRG